MRSPRNTTNSVSMSASIAVRNEPYGSGGGEGPAHDVVSEIEKGGGKGDFLREEAARWSNDLKQRYPSSNWAKKAANE